MGRIQLKAGAMLAPLPPALVTVGDMEHPNVLTIGWTGILCSHPPKTYVSIRPSRYSYTLLKEGGDFVIHLPNSRMAKGVDYCGVFTGRKVNKFQKCGWEIHPSEAVKAPTIADCPIALECRVTDVIPMGTHDVFMADIVSVSVDESILDENGKLCMDKADLIAYAHGEYYKLGKKLGRFGFSADKKKKRGRGKPDGKTK